MKQNRAIICSLFFLAFAVENSSQLVSQAAVATSSCELKAENGDSGEYSEKQLQTLASRIILRVIGDRNGGSGTLLAKQGNSYLVLTNSHVVRGVNSVNIKTSDGKTYPAKSVTKTHFEKFDLALLQFQSNQNYCLPNEIAKSVPNKETPVMAAGYSSEKGQIVFRTGIVQQIASKPLKEGYSIGYTSDIEQGMSGGAILNSRGELIGINGRSAYPILNTGYTYPDGLRLTEEEIKQMRSVSWGIPVSTFLAQVHTEILTAYSLPVPKTPPNVPETKLSGWLGELEQKAKQITVRIDSSSNTNGSGIIIAKDGDTYTVLTAAHVVCEREEVKQPCGNSSYQILAPDGKEYPVDIISTRKTEEGVDLGVVKFTASNQNYQVAILANYNPSSYVFTGGYPKLGDNYSPWRLTMGIIFEKERGLLAVQESDFQSDSSGSLQSASSLTGGYELVYTNITYGGMSGGPMLDSLGRVIGIHGRAEGEEVNDEKTGDLGSSEGKVQIGYSLGIPVSTFLGIAKRLGVQGHKIERTIAPPLDAQQLESIEQAVLSVDVSKGNTTASQWLERGNQLWRLRRYEEAVLAFDKAIKLKPSFVYLAYYGKGLALGSDRKYRQAIAAFEQAVKDKPNFVAAWQTKSFLYRDLNQLDKALVAIDKAIQLQPKNPNLYNEKWVVLNDLKRYAEAEVAINKAIEINSRAAFYSNRGNLYLEYKKGELALADFNQALQINPQFANAYNNRGILYSEQKKGELALVDYNQALKINPQFANAYNNRGLLYSEQRKWELALADFNQALTINPQFANVYYNRGNLYKEQKKWDLAIADFNQALTINPQDTTAYNNRGVIYKEQKKWDLALADFNQALKINPQNATAYNNRGVIYKEQKKWDLALADFNQALTINPQFANVYYNRGNLYKEQKKWDLAIADFNQALTINPQDTTAYNNRGVIYKEQKKWDLALADFNQALKINPQYALAYNNRGNLYTEQRKWELALADFNQALKIDPQLANAYYNRGVIYTEQKKWELALADYNQALKINPQDATAYIRRGNLYYEQRKWELALVDFNQALKINPQFANAYNNRGNLYTEQRKWELALADFNQALKINPQYALAYNNRGNLYTEQRKWELALADFNQALKIDPQLANAYYNRGVIYTEQKKWELALADFNQTLKINPQLAFAYGNRGLVYEQMGNKQRAIQDLQQAAQLFQAEGKPADYEKAINILKKLQR